MKEPGHWFVYMLECDNGSFYTGSTDDIARRYEEHRRGTAKAKYTRSFRPVRLAACWRLAGVRGTALRVERAIQGMDRREKMALVADPSLLAGLYREGTGADLDLRPYDYTHGARESREITGYRPGRGDTDGNPYLEEVLAITRPRRRASREAIVRTLNEERAGLIARYAFSIPTPDIVREIARLSPLIEIGAGSGYWARCLGAAGADIVAYDTRPPGDETPWDVASGNRWFEEEWFNVMKGDASMAGRYPERSLFLCWPPIHDPMAADALNSYRAAGGKTLAYIGSPGSSGDEAFHRELDGLKLQMKLGLWSWPGLDERLMIYSF